MVTLISRFFSIFFHDSRQHLKSDQIICESRLRQNFLACGIAKENILKHL